MTTRSDHSFFLHHKNFTSSDFQGRFKTRDPKISHCSDDIYNLALIVEQPRFSFHEHNRGGKLDKLGTLSYKRWEHIETVHIIIPSPCQYYLINDLTSTHYQASLEDTYAAIRNAPCSCKVTFSLYPSHQNHKNNFLLLVNRGKVLSRISKQMHWEKYTDLVETAKPGKVKKVKRQARYVDSGWTSTICMTRTGYLSGVSGPALKKITCHFREAFSLLSELTLGVLHSKKDHPLYTNWDSEDRRFFSGKIGDNNFFESRRYNKTDMKNLQHPHLDKHNSKSMPFVAGLSVIRNNLRQGFTVYFRKSVDVHIERVQVLLPFTKLIANKLATFAPERRNVSQESINNPNRIVNGYLLMPLCESPCNLDPSNYTQIFVFSLACLKKEFPLTLPGMVSVWTSFDVVPNVGCYMAEAVQLLIKYPPMFDLQEYDIGLLLAHTIANLHEELHKKDHKHRPRYRFHHYQKVLVPDREQWVGICKQRLAISLHTHLSHSSIHSDKCRKAVYDNVLALLIETYEGTGRLIATHLISIGSQLGILPGWMCLYAKIPYNSKPMEFFFDKFKGLNEGGQAGCDKVISELRVNLGHYMGCPVSLSYIENFLCKIF